MSAWNSSHHCEFADRRPQFADRPGLGTSADQTTLEPIPAQRPQSKTVKPMDKREKKDPTTFCQEKTLH